jgi:hypothetical protein
MSPFDETRNARLSLDVALSGRADDLDTKLRAPESIAHLTRVAKPAHVSVGTFALKGMLDAHLLACIVAGDYRTAQRTLGTLFGPEGPDGPAPVGAPRKPLAPVPGGPGRTKRHARTLEEVAACR